MANKKMVCVNKDVKEYKRLGDYAAIALLIPEGKNEYVWRYRNEGDWDYPEHQFKSLREFERFIRIEKWKERNLMTKRKQDGTVCLSIYWKA